MDFFHLFLHSKRNFSAFSHFFGRIFKHELEVGAGAEGEVGVGAGTGTGVEGEVGSAGRGCGWEGGEVRG